MDKNKSLAIANYVTSLDKPNDPSDDKLITVEITQSQYDEFIRMTTIANSCKFSTVQRTSNLLEKCEKVIEQIELKTDSISNLTKMVNCAKGLLDVIAKLQGEYSNVMNHPIVIEILDQFTTITAVCPTCKQKAYTVIKSFS